MNVRSFYSFFTAYRPNQAYKIRVTLYDTKRSSEYVSLT